MNLRLARRAAAVLALVVAALGLAGTATAAAGTAAPVVLLLVPDLRWTDLATMPHLQQLASRAAVGQLSVRAESGSTRCGDGLLELSAGTRVPTGVVPCRVDDVALARHRASYRHSRYDARVGTLGDALARHAVALDPAAAVALAGRQGPARTAPSLAAALRDDPAAVVAAVDDGLYDGTDRAAAATAVDARLAAQLDRLTPAAVVLVVGVSDAPGGGPHLHPLLVAGAGWPHRALTSASTGRAGYTQLIDVTATVLAIEHLPRPSWVSGRPVHVSSSPVRSAASYADADRHAGRALTVGHPTFEALCGVLIGCLLLHALRRREVVPVTWLLVFAPVATWLVQVVPWWRWPVLAYSGLLAAVAVAGAVAGWLVTRRSPVAAYVVGPAVTALVLVGDQLAGAPLQLAAPFGDNPLVAGRFHGMGNIDFAVSMAALLTCAAMLAARARDRRAAVTLTAVVCLAAVVVDGAPMLGDDVGGVLALVPAAAVLLAFVAGVRVTWRRAVAVAVVAVAVAAGAATLDYLRPADRQTHAGRFVGQVLHGGAWTVVHRKLDAVLGSFGTPLVTAVVVVAVVALVATPLARHWPPAWRRAGVAVAVLALVGSLVNDSGVFVAAAALLAWAPAALVSGARAAPRDNRSL